MGLIFPTSPSVGQTYPLTATPGVPQYVWDGVTWVMKGSSINPQIYVADAAPSSPVDGALWWSSTDGVLYLRYYDGDSRAWVQCAPSAADYAALTAYTDRMVLDANTNLVINGGMEVSQEFGSVAQVIANGAFKYMVDQWIVYVNGNGAMAFDQRSDSVLPVRGFRNSLRIYANPTGYNMATASDLITANHPIEGTRWARLGYGGAGALPVTLSFWTLATVAGTISVGIKNGLGGAATRSYMTTVTINAPLTWEYKSVTIPGDIAGTWAADTSCAATLVFTFGAHSSMHISPNIWTAGNQYAATGQSNLFAANNSYVFLAGISVVPGSIGPSATQSPLVMRTYDEDLLLCLRYWESGGPPMNYRSGAGVAGIVNAYDTLRFLVPKRIGPTMSFSTGWQYYNTSDGFIAFTPTSGGSNIQGFTFIGGGLTNFKAWTANGTWTANARL